MPGIFVLERPDSGGCGTAQHLPLPLPLPCLAVAFALAFAFVFAVAVAVAVAVALSVNQRRHPADPEGAAQDVRRFSMRQDAD
ncbi:hypothetical protein [Luteimonas mephitis]|uniref:hypothetical protein n=1 Tax=Luteimonas mephitis TaxID=83615 RepID=UPI003A933478